MEKLVISLQNIGKDYGKFRAVDNVTLNVKQGDIYGLIGKNGAGKTTLFKMILGLSDPSEGSVSINGSSDMASLLKEREKIGFFVGQNFFSYLNANDNIEYYRRLKGIEDKNETERVLKIVGLYGVNKPFKEYSMGMKQRLGIANAILGSPSIIILDEPINGLDPQGIVEVRNMLKMLNEKYGMTLIVSSHILSELDLVATRFGIIDKGVLVKEINKEHLDVGDLMTVVVRTSDDASSISLLKDAFKFEKIEDTEQGIKILNGDINTAEIVKYLVNQNIDVIEIFKKKESLEDIYFELTGGIPA